MSPEAVVARIETYASPGGGWWVDSRAIRTSPDEESRSSQAGSPSATPTVSVPEAVRSSTGALVAVTVMSPEPELARTGWCARLMVTSPDPDLATTGHCASPTVMSPEPETSRVPEPSPSPADTSPDPVVDSRSRARPTLMAPDPELILDRPISALTDTSAEPTLITYSRPGGTPSRRCALVLRKVRGGKLIRNQSRSCRTCTAFRYSSCPALIEHSTSSGCTPGSTVTVPLPRLSSTTWRTPSCVELRKVIAPSPGPGPAGGGVHRAPCPASPRRTVRRRRTGRGDRRRRAGPTDRWVRRSLLGAGVPAGAGEPAVAATPAALTRPGRPSPRGSARRWWRCHQRQPPRPPWPSPTAAAAG